MERIKQYAIAHFEQTFVFLVLISVSYISFFLTSKLAFLSFFFLPVLIAGYYLDLRRAVLGALLCVLVVSFYAYLEPQTFIMNPDTADLALYIFIWGAFLVLTGGMVGFLQQKLKEEIVQRLLVKDELGESRETLTAVTKDLIQQSERMEAELQKRTAHFQQAQVVIEDQKEKVEEALYTTMDPSVAKLIIEKKLRPEKRALSILFADLRSFNKYSEEKAADLVINELNRFFGAMEKVLLSYRAHIDKYMGDGIMAEFGAPMNYDRHALLSVMAGIKMQEAMRRSPFPWDMRIGIATGEVIIGLIGQNRQFYTALGDVVNLASRIEEVSRPGAVTIDESTLEHIRRFVNTRPLATQNITQVNNELAKKIEECLRQLNEKPDDIKMMETVGGLFMDAGEPLQAQDYFKHALKLEPSSEALKLALAESTLKNDELQTTTLQGRKRLPPLYEVTGIKDPLCDRSKIPEKLYERYITKYKELGEFPEDVTLPVEALDGTIGHSRTVSFLSFAIADVLKLSDREKQDIALAGFLCDIGKAIIPHDILNRAGSLSTEEFEEVKKHCREGERVLKELGFENEAVRSYILSHHEFIDGSGYPEGLLGNRISIGARIINVADSYDALTSWRTYRNAWDCTFAVSLLEKEAFKGKHDNRILEALNRLLSE